VYNEKNRTRASAGACACVGAKDHRTRSRPIAPQRRPYNNILHKHTTYGDSEYISLFFPSTLITQASRRKKFFTIAVGAYIGRRLWFYSKIAGSHTGWEGKKAKGVLWITVKINMRYNHTIQKKFSHFRWWLEGSAKIRCHAYRYANRIASWRIVALSAPL